MHNVAISPNHIGLLLSLSVVLPLSRAVCHLSVSPAVPSTLPSNVSHSFPLIPRSTPNQTVHINPLLCEKSSTLHDEVTSAADSPMPLWPFVMPLAYKSLT